MKKKFAKVECFGYNDSGEDYYRLQSLEAQDALLSPRQSPAESVDVEGNANEAPNVDESRMHAIHEDDDDWDI